MRSSDLASSLLFFAALSTAWPWPSSWQPVQAAKRELAPLWEKRADSSSSFNLDFTASKQGNTATTKKTTKATASKTQDNNNNNNQKSVTVTSSSAAQETNKNGKTTGKTTTGKDDGKTTAKVTSKYQTTKTYDARLPAGGVSMITPAIINGPQYYRISDFVTFKWNYTSLSNTPTAVDVLAAYSTTGATGTFTIAANQSVPADGTQAVTWDTGKYQATATIPLLIATYTLVIYDADSAVTAMPRAGYLGVFNQYTFGMYTPQPYQENIKKYVCATCNAASSSIVTHTIGFTVGMCAITVLSFGWFAGVAGLW